jgi:general secretion pathway protein H
MPGQFTSRTHRPGGYTLLELLIVVALLGLAGAVLVPSLVAGDSLKVQAAVRHLIGDLSFAQSDALAHQEFRRVVFFDDGSGYCIVRVTAAGFDEPFDPGTADYIEDPIGSAGNLGQYIVDFDTDSRFQGLSITTANLDGGNRYATYDALGGTVMTGMLPGTGGAIVIASDEEDYRLTVAPFTGKLTVSME